MYYDVSMKEMNDKMFLSVEEEEDMEMVEVELMDDGDWEYVRMGVGVMNGKTFVVDLDDSGEEWREMNFVKEGLSVEDVLRIGCEVGVLVEIDWGYDENDKVRVKMNDGEGDWEEFYRRLKE